MFTKASTSTFYAVKAWRHEEGALAVMGLFRSQLFEVTTAGPVIFTAAAILLGASAFAACMVSGHGATRVETMVALRYE